MKMYGEVEACFTFLMSALGGTLWGQILSLKFLTSLKAYIFCNLVSLPSISYPCITSKNSTCKTSQLEEPLYLVPSRDSRHPCCVYFIVGWDPQWRIQNSDLCFTLIVMEGANTIFNTYSNGPWLTITQQNLFNTFTPILKLGHLLVLCLDNFIWPRSDSNVPQQDKILLSHCTLSM
jgi:hypothetical protein